MNKSHLLINEQALQVLPSLALALGLEEAIVIQQLHYWLNNPKNEGRVDEDGNKWVYNTYAQWKEDNFPFFSEDKIQRIFLSLEKQGVVIARQLDAKRRDMKKFYRIDYDALCAMDDAILRPSNTPNLHDVKMNQRIPENTDNNISERKEPDILDGILQAELAPKSIREAMKKFPFNVKWEGKQAREFMEWVVAEEITPEQVVAAADVWRMDKAFNWQQPTLKGVFEKWPALMAAMVKKKYGQDDPTSLIRTIGQ